VSYIFSERAVRSAASRRRASSKRHHRGLLTVAIALAAIAGAAALLWWRRSSSMVHTPVQVGLVAVAGAAVAVADSLIKRAAGNSTSFSAALSNPMMFLAVALYILQIALIAFVFVQHWDFTLVTFSQMIMYGITVVFVSTIIFQERITPAHWAGLSLALAGAIIMSS
jgi:drug/metabolite transporter (DMT)-like permease